MIEDLKSLIRIPSEKQAAEPGKPFGAPGGRGTGAGKPYPGKIRICRNQLRQLCDCSGFNGEEKGLDILAHLDVVPAGEGWQETDPFIPALSKTEKCSAAEPQTTKTGHRSDLRDARCQRAWLSVKEKMCASSSAPMRNAEVPILNTIIKKKQKRHAPSLRTPSSRSSTLKKGGMRGHFEKSIHAGTTACASYPYRPERN